MLSKYDIVWITVEPSAGIEEGGHDPANGNDRRPFLVCSNKYYNQTGMIIGMPITSHNYSFDPLNNYLIPLRTNHNNIKGYLIPFKIAGYDYVARKARKADVLNDACKNIVNVYLKNALCDE